MSECQILEKMCCGNQEDSQNIEQKTPSKVSCRCEIDINSITKISKRWKYLRPQIQPVKLARETIDMHNYFNNFT